MIQWLLDRLLGGGIQAAKEAWIATKTSEVEKDRIRAEVAEAELAHALESRRIAQQIRLATAGFWEMRFLVFCIAGSFTLHLVAVTLDTVFGLGWRIPKFPPPFDEYQGAVLLSFFGLQAGVKIATTAATAFMTRR